jgi:hypothetical protein
MVRAHDELDHVAAILTDRANPFISVALEPGRVFRLRIIRADRARPDVLEFAGALAQANHVAGDSVDRVAILDRLQIVVGNHLCLRFGRLVMARQSFN